MKTALASLGLLLAAAASAGAGIDILQNHPDHSPFAYILGYLRDHPGKPECYINEGYLNFTQDDDLDPRIVPTDSSGTNNIRVWPYPLGSEAGSPDITRRLLSGINAIPGAGAQTHVAVSRHDCDGCSHGKPYLAQVLPAADLHTDLPAHATHGKTIQCSNGRVYLTQNGSLNMQTVGATTKANSSLVFVEIGSAARVPRMYQYFRSLWEAVVRDTGAVFKGGGPDSSGLSGMTTPVMIGGRPVSFYAGRRHAFVGPTWSDGGLSIPFPNNLYPPSAGELANPGNLRVVNWYDQILLDAGTQLSVGHAVTVDIFMFEIGESNPFIDNLYRLVKYGFVDCPVPECPGYGDSRPVAISKKRGARPPAVAFPGSLTVNLYYQFQDGCEGTKGCSTRTYAYLHAPVAAGSPNYRMNVRKVWQGFKNSRMPGNPDAPHTPQDMHLKVGVLTFGPHVKLYVSSSNLDTPDRGSGKKWQAGNIIQTSPSDGLYRLYLQEFRSIAEDGNLSQYRLGFINAVGNSYFDDQIRPGSRPTRSTGIAAFVFPLNTSSDGRR